MLTKRDEKEEFYEALRKKVMLSKILGSKIPIYVDGVYGEKTLTKINNIILEASNSPEFLEHYGITLEQFAVLNKFRFRRSFDLVTLIYKNLGDIIPLISTANTISLERGLTKALENGSLESDNETKERVEELREKLRTSMPTAFDEKRIDETLKEKLEQLASWNKALKVLRLEEKPWLVEEDTATLAYPIHGYEDLVERLGIKLDRRYPNYGYFHTFKERAVKLYRSDEKIKEALMETSALITIKMLACGILDEGYDLVENKYMLPLIKLVSRGISVDEKLTDEDELFVQNCVKGVLAACKEDGDKQNVYSYKHVNEILRTMNISEFTYENAVGIPTYEVFKRSVLVDKVFEANKKSILTPKSKEQQRREFYDLLRTKILLCRISSDYMPLLSEEVYPEESISKLEGILRGAGINPDVVKEQGLTFGQTVIERIAFAQDLAKELSEKVYNPLCNRIDNRIACLNIHIVGRAIKEQLENGTLDDRPELREQATKLYEGLKNYSNKDSAYTDKYTNRLINEINSCNDRIELVGIPTEQFLIKSDSPIVARQLEDKLDLIRQLGIDLDQRRPNYAYYKALIAKLEEITTIGVSINDALREISIAHTMNVMGTSIFDEEDDDKTHKYTMGRSIYLDALIGLTDRKANIEDDTQTEEEAFVQRCVQTLLKGYVGTVQEALVYNYDEIRSLCVNQSLRGCDFEYVDENELPTYDEFVAKTDGGSPKELNLALGSMIDNQQTTEQRG